MSSVQITPQELEDMLNRAAAHGAKKALSDLGLHDENASADLNEIRSLLTSWRETRKAIWATTVKIATTAILLFICGAVWMSVKDKVGQ
jgi:Family of unknown function (DUF6127)